MRKAKARNMEIGRIDLFLLFVSLESCSLDNLQGIVGRGRSKLSHKLEEDRRVRVMRGIGISCGQYDSMVRSSQSTKVRVFQDR
jgi:hypothetical protein